jgi:hypothetical protein
LVAVSKIPVLQEANVTTSMARMTVDKQQALPRHTGRAGMLHAQLQNRQTLSLLIFIS